MIVQENGEEAVEGSLLAAGLDVFWQAQKVSFASTQRGLRAHINVRGSFRILSFTPWSAKDRDKNVDSAIPGKLFGGDTLIGLAPSPEPELKFSRFRTGETL